MKKIIALILSLAFICWSADTYYNPVVDNGFRASNIKIYPLSDADITDARDTIDAGEDLIVGPYPMTNTTNSPAYKAMGFCAQQLGTADSVQVSYQITRGQSISDTIIGKWTAADTISDSGAVKNYIDISQKWGSFLFIRLLNYTASEVVLKEIDMYLKKDMSFNKDL